MRVQVSLRALLGRHILCLIILAIDIKGRRKPSSLFRFNPAMSMRLRTDSLSTRIRFLVTVSALYSLQRRSKAHAIVHQALQRGDVNPHQLIELFIHLSLFLGDPSMLDGLESVAESSMRRRAPTSLRSRSSSAHVAGKKILEQIYGKQTQKLLRHLDSLAPGLGHRITQDAYGLVMSRRGLNLRDRELVNVVVLFAHGYDRQLYSHLRGALRVGVPRKTLKLVISLAATTVGKTPRGAYAMLERLTKE